MALEMISLKSQREIEAMRRAGRITAQARALAGSMVRPGVSTHEIDRAVRRFIESHGAKPSFLGYGGFPASACISINEEVIHGIPGPRKLKEGDIVSVDVGARMHEAPEVRNFGPAGHGPRLQPGMTIAVEPMVCAGDWHVRVLEDKWTTVSQDGSLTAHYENTILVTDGDPEVLTVTEDGAYV